jgi:monofunctional glycosyltransferase
MHIAPTQAEIERRRLKTQKPARQASRGIFGWLFRRLLYLVVGWLAFSVLLVLALRWLDPPTSAFMVREQIGAWFSGDDKFQFQHRWVDWEQIAAPMKVAVIASEDQAFPDHNGFDFRQINRALEQRERNGRSRGASTISQQVAKNLFLWSGRSWLRKGLEAFYTVLIELLWSKQRILEVYLNIAEFGTGTFGVAAASETFFRKPAARLDNENAALLAAVLPSPKRMRVNAPSRYMKYRQRQIVGQMRSLGGRALLKKLDAGSSVEPKKAARSR